jgi:hypothetical protein
LLASLSAIATADAVALATVRRLTRKDAGTRQKATGSLHTLLSFCLADDPVAFLADFGAVDVAEAEHDGSDDEVASVVSFSSVSTGVSFRPGAAVGRSSLLAHAAAALPAPSASATQAQPEFPPPHVRLAAVFPDPLQLLEPLAVALPQACRAADRRLRASLFRVLGLTAQTLASMPVPQGPAQSHMAAFLHRLLPLALVYAFDDEPAAAAAAAAAAKALCFSPVISGARMDGNGSEQPFPADAGVTAAGSLALALCGCNAGPSDRSAPEELAAPGKKATKRKNPKAAVLESGSSAKTIPAGGSAACDPDDIALGLRAATGLRFFQPALLSLSAQAVRRWPVAAHVADAPAPIVLEAACDYLRTAHTGAESASAVSSGSSSTPAAVVRHFVQAAVSASTADVVLRSGCVGSSQAPLMGRAVARFALLFDAVFPPDLVATEQADASCTCGLLGLLAGECIVWRSTDFFSPEEAALHAPNRHVRAIPAVASALDAEGASELDSVAGEWPCPHEYTVAACAKLLAEERTPLLSPE